MSASDAELLTLVPVDSKLTKANSITFKLRVNPAEANSPTYEKAVPIISGSEGVRAALEFSKYAEAIVVGMNAQTTNEKDIIVRRMLKGTALTAYTQGRDESQSRRHGCQQQQLLALEYLQ